MIYTIINLYFVIFNWKVFTVTLSINLGPGSVQLPPFIILFLVGFIIIGILSWSNYVANLQKIILELKHGTEPGRIRDKLVKYKLYEGLTEKKNIDLLKKELGIESIVKKQESLEKLLNGMLQEKQDQG